MSKRIEFIDGQRVIIETPIDEDRQGMTCTRLQARLALGEAVCAVLDAMADDQETPWVLQQTLKFAQTWQRTHPDIEAIGTALGYSPDQMDDLFRVAAKL